MRAGWLLVLALGLCCAGPSLGKGSVRPDERAKLSVSLPKRGLVTMRLRHSSLDHMRVRYLRIHDSRGFTWQDPSPDLRKNAPGDVTLLVGIDEIAGSLIPAGMPWEVTFELEKVRGFRDSDTVRVPFQQSFVDEQFWLSSDSTLFKRLHEGWAMDVSTREFRMSRRISRIDGFVYRPLRVEWKGGATAYPEAESDGERAQSGSIPGDATNLVLVARRCRYVVWRPITVGAATLEPSGLDEEIGL